MRPAILSPGTTRLRVRFWAKVQSTGSVDQYELIDPPVEANALLAHYNDRGAIVLVEEDGVNFKEHHWQAIVGWADVIAELETAK